MSRLNHLVVEMRQQRTMVDLRGFGPALKAYATARQLSVPEAARLALASVIKPLTPQVRDTSVSDVPDATAEKPAKLSVRLTRSVATRLSTRAQACGLSYGAYLSCLIDETPAPSIEVAAALNASTDQLAVALTDLRELSRMMPRDACPCEPGCKDAIRGLMTAVRCHLAHASLLLAELQPGARGAGRSGEQGTRHDLHP
jgi:hypothetical protein